MYFVKSFPISNYCAANGRVCKIPQFLKNHSSRCTTHNKKTFKNWMSDGIFFFKLKMERVFRLNFPVCGKFFLCRLEKDIFSRNVGDFSIICLHASPHLGNTNFSQVKYTLFAAFNIMADNLGTTTRVV